MKVMVRARPLNQTEMQKGCQGCVEIDRKLNQVILQDPKDPSGERIFTFDSVYGPESGQRQVFDETAFPLVESVLQGYNGTIFAYGQTGCGKTHTMMGEPSESGIIPLAFE